MWSSPSWSGARFEQSASLVNLGRHRYSVAVIRPNPAFLAILLPLVLASGLCAQAGAPAPAGVLPQSQAAVPVPAPPSPAQEATAASKPASAPPAAAAAAGPLPDDPTVFLGKSLAEVTADRGLPLSMAAIRGPEVWQDDVEFSWGDGSHFDWYADRVWRIDFDKDYKGSVFGIFIGDSSDKALSLLGQPHFTAADGLVWRLPWRGYPVQLRLAVKDGIVTDIAVFRADL